MLSLRIDPELLVPSQALMLVTTVEDGLLAKRLAHVLVEERLAACVNLGAKSLSMYEWQGVLEGDEEITLTIKTVGDKVLALAQRLTELHPYDVPELLVLPVIGGSEAYLDWLVEQTRVSN